MNAEDVVRAATARGLTIAVAESLTGGALTSALVDVPGASAVLRCGVVAYDTRMKATLLGVDRGLLSAEGAVHPEVAMQMAEGVRRLAGIDGVPASLAVSTTGVAGPQPQDGRPVGLVYVGTSWSGADGRGVRAVREHRFDGGRAEVRAAAVAAGIAALSEALAALADAEE